MLHKCGIREPKGPGGIDGVEFYGQVSFLKSGLAFADRLSTVSPTYAREIQTPELGYQFVRSGTTDRFVVEQNFEKPKWIRLRVTLTWRINNV